VLSAADTMITAQRQLADLRSRTFTLDVSLVRALGGGYQHPSISTNPNQQS
jgi:outer membrane protein TolC